MDIAFVRFLALTFTPAITASARPALTFAATQFIVLGLVRAEQGAVPADLAWLVSAPALVVGVLFAVVEALARSDEDVDGVLRELHLDKVAGSLSVFTTTLLFGSMGLAGIEPSLSVDVPVQAAAMGGAALGFPLVVAAMPSLSAMGTATGVTIVAAIAINTVLVTLRGWMMDALDVLGLSRWWLRLETGGVVAVLVLVPFLPLVVMGLLVVLSALAAFGGVVARGAERHLDRRARRPCPSCGHGARVEAARCPKCRGALTPVALSPDATAGLWTAWRRAREGR